MLESIIIVGIAMTIVEIIKNIPLFNTNSGKLSLPIISCLICGGLNVLNARLFGNEVMTIALKDGIMMGALASGLYATGKKYLGGSTVSSATVDNKNVQDISKTDAVG